MRHFPSSHTGFIGHGVLPAQAPLFLCLLCLSLAAVAGQLQVGELSLDYAAPWQRAEAAEERAADSAILRLARDGELLQVLLPRHQARLRMDEAQFFKQLEFLWHAQYGRDIAVSWVEAGGRRWRMVRRPSVERPETVVFHLVTVHQGSAHHLLVYAPVSAAALPGAVRQLLQGGAAGPPAAPPDPPDLPSAGMQLAAAQGEAAQGIPPPAAADAAPPLAAVLPKPPAPVPRGDTPAAPAAAERWQLKRVVRALPRGAALDALVQREAAGLGGQGGVTGYAVEGRDHGLIGFLEGFRWMPGAHGRDRKQTCLRRWDLRWRAPEPLWTEGASIALEADFGGTAASEPEARLTLGYRLRLLCGLNSRLLAAIAALERGAAGAAAELDALEAACGAVTSDLPTGVIVNPAASGGGSAARREVTLPRRLGQAAATGPARRLVLSLLPGLASPAAGSVERCVSGSGSGPWGGILLDALAVHYLYAPEARAETAAGVR